jgi:hypothetical protein
MTGRRTAAALEVLIGLFLFGTAFRASLEWHVLKIPRVPARTIEQEDPEKRDAYEWLRLRDPATGMIPPQIRQRELAFAGKMPSREDIRNGLARRGLSATGLEEITWSQRGPYNVGGRTRALAVDLTNPGILLAGAVSGGMWRSTNQGMSWIKTTLADQLHSVTCIAQDPRPGHTAVWYYGTGELRGNSASGGGGALYRGDGIFKSTDGGNSWKQLPSTVTNHPDTYDQMFDYVWNIAVDSSSSQDVVYAATIGGVLRSTNGGTTWQTVLGGQGTGNSRYTDIAVSSTGVVYATMSSANLNLNGASVSQGVWRSTDGLQWTDIRPVNPPWPVNFNRIVIGIARSNENTVYLMGETPGYGKQTTSGTDSEWNSFWKYTYIAGDGRGSGGQWENRSANLPGFGQPVGDFYSQSSYNLVVKVSPVNDSLVFFGATNLYRAANGLRTTAATSWIGGYAPSNNVEQYPSHHCDQHALVFSPLNPSILYSGNDGGVYLTGDCLASPVVWESLNNGYNTTQFYTIALDNATAGNSVLVGGTQDNSTLFVNSLSGTAPWTDIFVGDGAFCAVADGRSTYYVSAQEGLTYRLQLNASGQLNNFTRVDPTGGSDYLFINPFALDPSNNAIMYLAGGSALWRNGNLLGIPLGGNATTSVNWTRMTGADVGGGAISALGVSRTSPRSRLFYGTSDGRVFRLEAADNASPSTVPADVWTNRGLPGGAYVSSITVDPTDGNRALLVFSNYGVRSIFFTADAGQSWVDVSGNLEQNTDGSGSGPSVRWGAILTYGGGPTYFVGTSTGLYSTTTLSGSSTVWMQEGTASIGNVVVDMVAARSLDGLVAVGTHGQGVFTGNAPPVGPPPVPETYTTELQPVYPNPLALQKTAFATISFTLENPGPVTLTVYDLNGQKVETLVNEQREAGKQPDVYWYPARVASGVYFCELRAPGGKITRKIVLLR